MTQENLPQEQFDRSRPARRLRASQWKRSPKDLRKLLRYVVTKGIGELEGDIADALKGHKPEDLLIAGWVRVLHDDQAGLALEVNPEAKEHLK